MKLRNSRLQSLMVGLGAVAFAGCVDKPGLDISSTAQESTVNDYATSGCSTSVVLGLSAQIAQEAACVNPDSFVSFEGASGISLTSSAALPYLVKGAADDLKKVAANHPLQINSALRTIGQQYLLYRWYQQGRCGITAAAHPGNSNHEGGRAVDVANYSSRISNMSAYGWKHDVPGDVVHFDHTASADNRGQDVEAFQRLWNLNNPNDKIAEDGDYGPQTEARLKKAPATGFAIGSSCGNGSLAQPQGLTVASVQGPDTVSSGATAHFSFTLQNTGTADWSDTTTIQTADGATSPLWDSQTWASSSQVGTIPHAVVAGDSVVVELDVQAPQVDADTPIAAPLQLVDGGTLVGTINLGVTVMAQVDGTPSTPTSSDGNDPDPAEPPPSQQTVGGCSAGGGAGGLLLALAPMMVALRRRRRS